MNLVRQNATLADEILASMRDILATAGFIGGQHNEALESDLAERLGVRHAIGVASGTDAIHLALRAAGIGAGDEVITTPYTFAATAGAICQAGARPVFADIDPDSFNLSPAAVERAVTERTRALLPVHIFGQAADMPALQAIAGRHRLVVIEDCAQSFGATLGGAATGSFGLAGAFSFYPTKNLGGCGDGGLVTSSSDALAERLRRLANHGMRAPQEFIEAGFNSRLDAFQAAALRVKLRHVESWNEARRRIAGRYAELLGDLPVRLPRIGPDRVHVFHVYNVLVERRDEVAAELRRAGIGTAAWYATPLHRQSAFAAFAPATALPVAEDVARRCLSLPIFPELEDHEVEEVAAALRRAVER